MLTRRGLGVLGAAGLLSAGAGLVALTGSSAGSPAPAAPVPPPTVPLAAPSGGPVPAPSTSPPVRAPAAGPATSASRASPTPPRVVRSGTGRLQVVPGSGRRSGGGPLRTYRVQVEGGLGIGPVDFAAQVERTLGDERSWGAGGRLSFQRVDDASADFSVVLASPRTTDRLCLPLDTAGIYSCGIGDTAVINAMRWLEGADAYAGQLAAYRQYVVNHEVGHVLGHAHESCPGRGEPAPVMLQQTKGVGVCTAQPWPYG